MSSTSDLRSLRVQQPPQRRIFTIAVVGALHIAAIYTLFLAFTHRPSIPAPPPVLTGTVILPKVIPTTQHPPTTVVLVRPGGPTAVKPPVIDIDQNGDHGLTTLTSLQPPPTGLVFVPAHPIASTHTIPDYPPLSARLDQEGTVQLKLTIDEHGAVADASVLKSSGFERLDQAAVAWVKAHWRYEPATSDGKPVAATTGAVVTFRLTGR